MSDPVIVDGMRGGVCYDSGFPTDSADEIIKWARKAGVRGAERLTNEIREWLGAPSDVVVLAETWSPGASSLVIDAKHRMSTALADTRTYWEGPAFDAYEAYSTHVTSVIDEVSTILTDMSGLLFACRETITETYKAGVEFIGACAVTLLEAAGSIAQGWKDLWGGVCAAILNALAGFVDAVTQLELDKADILTAHIGNGLLLKQKASSLAIPDPLADSASETGNWNVREPADV